MQKYLKKKSREEFLKESYLEFWHKYPKEFLQDGLEKHRQKSTFFCHIPFRNESQQKSLKGSGKNILRNLWRNPMEDCRENHISSHFGILLSTIIRHPTLNSTFYSTLYATFYFTFYFALHPNLPYHLSS